MFGKHFVSMYTGSMVGAGLNVFAVWGYVIANVVKGNVELNPKYLALVLGGTEDDIVAAIDYLSQPDPNSRSSKHEGRRLIRDGQFQYVVPTAEKYRHVRSEEERREYMRKYMQDYRKRAGVNNVNPGKPQLAHAEAEAEAETETETNNVSCTEPGKAPASVPELLKGLELYEGDKKLCKRLPKVLEAWKTAYPGVNLRGEIAKAHAWEKSNPKKAKRDRIRFLVNWLNRAQDRGGGSGGGGSGTHTSAAPRRLDKAAIDAQAEALAYAEAKGRKPGKILATKGLHREDAAAIKARLPAAREWIKKKPQVDWPK